MHRFLAPETAACFDGVTTTQVRTDLAEMAISGMWERPPGWVLKFVDLAVPKVPGDAFEAGLRFIVDRERAEIADRLRSVNWSDGYEASIEVAHLADELDPED